MIKLDNRKAVVVLNTALSYKSVARVARQEGPGGEVASGWLLADALLCGLAAAISLQWCGAQSASWPKYFFDFMAVPLTCALAAAFGLYQSSQANRWRANSAIFASTALGFGMPALFALLATARLAPASEFRRAWGLAFLLLSLAHLVRRLVWEKPATLFPPVVLLGNPSAARSLYRAWSELTVDEPRPRLAAVFSDGATEWPEATRQNIVVSETRWAESFVECCGIEHAILAVPAACDRATEELFSASAEIFKYLLVAPQSARGENVVAVTNETPSELFLHVGQKVIHRGSQLKRGLDFVGALAIGVLTLPFAVLVALAIKLTSQGPVLYKQMRIGKGNRAFKALKFRTMYPNGSERLHEYLATDPALRAEWESVHKLRHDPRVTIIGRFLRRFSLDELPQLWNVLAGEMSLVGPRPIVVAEIEKYGQSYAAYERVRPGLTGLWQVSGRNDTTYQERVDFDFYYVNNWSLALDARIALRTVRAVISGVGAY